MLCLCAVLPGLVRADDLRLATWHGDLSRKGPGLLVRDLVADKPVPGLDMLAALSPDVIVLTKIDYDAGHVALGLVADRLGGYAHLFALRPNTGRPTGIDLDGDGYLGGPRDAQGFGWFGGQAGMAVLSRYPLRLEQDHSALLWRDAPQSAQLPSDTGVDIQRLSTSAHWALRVDAPVPLTLLTLAATPPVFDGPEDRNGRRNRDEVLLWAHVMDGALGPPPPGPVVMIGNLNVDPHAGDGIRAAAAQVLDHPRLQDPLPGQPTAEWDSVGALRVSYILPDRAVTVVDAGITPLPEGDPHRIVWVDLAQ